MVKYSVGQIVALDLVGIGRRPALVVATPRDGQCIICQITAQAYGRLQVMELSSKRFEPGCLINGGCAQLTRLATIGPGEIKQVLGVLTSLAIRDLRARLRQVFYG
jgi:hypothetical protein